MKNLKYVYLLILLVFSCFIVLGCGKDTSDSLDNEITQEQISSIGKLATIECYYNNVAHLDKAKEDSDNLLTKLIGKDRKMWIEYTGFVRVGVDMKKVGITQNGSNVTVTMPDAEILDIGIVDDTFTEDSIITSDDSFFAKNKITYDDQKKMIEYAQEDMKTQMANDSALLEKSKTRAKSMIESYIHSMGEIKGTYYSITWK